MKGSPTTFEHTLRERLLNVVYDQWRALGVPFSIDASLGDEQVIDPEALLWCSLEFLPTEPRLYEGVAEWLLANKASIIRRRISSLVTSGEPRNDIWQAINKPHAEGARKGPADWSSPALRARPEGGAGEPSHGLESVEDVRAFCRAVEQRPRAQNAVLGRKLPGRPIDAPSTVILRARDLLGNDVRHFLLVYLVANHGQGWLRTIQTLSRYNYRSLSETVNRWEKADVLRISQGHCRLKHVGAWRTLLGRGADRAVIVNWHLVFEACVALLRVLAKARRGGLDPDGPTITAIRNETREAFDSAILGDVHILAPSVDYLQELI